MKSANILFNQYRNLRSGWRFAVFLFGLFFFLVVCGIIISAAVHLLPVSLTGNNSVGFIVQSLMILTASIVIGWLCGKYLEDLPFRALGCWFVEGWTKNLILGLGLGALTICLAALITVASGATTFRFNETAGQAAIAETLAFSLLVFTLGAASEEALFRGYILQTFSRARLMVFGILLTSILFGYTHTNNPSANYLSFINTILAGLWFGAAYLKTRTLWFAFGLHLAWNWVLGAVLGISVSGINAITPAPLLQPIYTGSTFLTGGDYGIEGGIACTIALLISILLIWFLPIFKPTEEMLILTGQEKSKVENSRSFSPS